MNGLLSTARASHRRSSGQLLDLLSRQDLSQLRVDLSLQCGQLLALSVCKL